MILIQLEVKRSFDELETELLGMENFITTPYKLISFFKSLLFFVQTAKYLLG